MKLQISPRYFLLFAIITSLCGIAGAQSSVNRVEFFGGYSHNRVDTTFVSDDFDESFGGRVGTNGVNFSLTGNFSKYVGAKFDYAHHRKSETIDFDGFQFEEKYRNDTIMGGIQIKNNAKDGPRVKPFFHALAGISRQKFAVTESTEDIDLSFSQSNFTFALGGGLDVRATKHLDIRVFQFDYNPTYFKDVEFPELDNLVIDGRLQNNFRFGFGIVIH
jgi:opacity protein-like surface antigen